MAEGGTRRVTIRFTDEQRELIRREFGEDIAEWEVDIPAGVSADTPPETVDGRPPRGIVVLTDRQRGIIKEATGRTCNYIRLENWPVDKYGTPPAEYPR